MLRIWTIETISLTSFAIYFKMEMIVDYICFDIMFPISLCYFSIWIFENSMTMFHSFLPVTFVLVTFLIYFYAKSVRFVVFELSNVFSAIWPHLHAFSFHVSEFPCSIVMCAVRWYHLSFSMLFTFIKHTLVYCAIFIIQSSLSMK